MLRLLGKVVLCGSDRDFDVVFLTIIDEMNGGVRLLLAVDDHAGKLRAFPSGPFHGEVVKRLLVTVV